MEGVSLYKMKKLGLNRANVIEMAYWAFFVVTLMVKCFYYQFTTRLNIRPYFSTVNIYMLIASFGMLMIIAALVILVSNRKRLLVLFVLNVVLSILLIADTNFFRYYYGIITVPVLMQVNLNLVSSVNESIMSLFKPKDIIFLLDFPIMLIALIKVSKKGITLIARSKRTAAALIIGLAGFVNVSVVLGQVQWSSLSYNTNYVAKTMGVFYSHYDSTKMYLEKTLFENESLTSEEKKDILELFNKKAGEKGKYNGIASGSNLMVVQVEALQQFVINRKINGREITPNLNKLVSESLYFDNFYYQVGGGNTSDAELLCNASLYPLKEGSVHTRFPENEFYTLPKELKKHGYNTYSMHAFRGDFYNRENMYPSLGFDVFYHQDDFELDEFAGWSGNNALSDASFFRQAMEKIDTTSPFYSFMITLSSHHPFEHFEDYSFNVGELQGSYVGNYIKAANYADECLGKLISDLKARGLYDNTLLVIYGDHSAVPAFKSAELMELLGKEFSDTEWVKLQKVPCIIHYPGLETGKVISTTGGQIDLFPTIANIMGIEARYAMGRDLLNTDKGYVVLRSGTVITDRYIYINDQGNVFDMENGVKQDKRLYEKEILKYLNNLSVSDLIIEKNAFKGLANNQLE